MTTFNQLIANTRDGLNTWLSSNLPKLGIAAGIGVTAWSIGATLGQLSSQAQFIGWGAAIAILSAELGKEFVVGLIERIRDNELSEEDIARIIQVELDRGLDLPDLRRLLDEVGTLPTTLEHVLRLNNLQLIQSLHADLATYPKLISSQTAQAVRAALQPQIAALSRDISSLDAKSDHLLAILTSLAATPYLASAPGIEPPLLVFVSSLIDELSAERQTLRQAIAGLRITRPWIFEFIPATSQTPATAYLEKVRTCDFFVLLIDEDISPAVEQEFETALQHNRPILAFLKKDKDDKEQHRSPATKILINRISAKWATFSGPTDLALAVRVSLTDEIIRRVRANLIRLPDNQLQHLQQMGTVLSRALLNLPPRRYTRLVGREKDIEEVLQRLRTPDPTAPAVIAMTGLGGIGKTAMAYEIAERAMLEGLYEGLVWESAKLEELEGSRIVRLPTPPSLSFETLVSAIAKQLGYETLLQLPPDERQNRLRSILQTGSYLIVVDNLETVASYEELGRQLHGLLSPSQSRQPSRALLTSREKLAETPYIYEHFIRGLSWLASMEFIRQEAHDRSAPGLLQAGRELLERIFKVTYGMPLAMKLIVSQYILGIPLDTELDRLEGAREEQIYEFIYMRLWFKLSISAQKVLIAAAAFASSVARFMLQPVSKTTDEEFENTIPELVRMSLIEPSDHPAAANRRYSIHPITRWFINAPLRELWERQKTSSQAT